LRWAVELGHINICDEVSMLAAYTTAPRLGHFDAMLHVFSFLHHNPRSRLVFDERYFDPIELVEHDWREIYPDASELLPPNAPHPLGETHTDGCFC
jgi:hypothetical protein